MVLYMACIQTIRTDCFIHNFVRGCSIIQAQEASLIDKTVLIVKIKK